MGKKKIKKRLKKGKKSKGNDLAISDGVVRTLKGIIYSVLELPARHNCQWRSEIILDVVVKAKKRGSCIEDAVQSVNRRLKKRGITVPTAHTVFNRIKKVFKREWTERFEKANDNLLKIAQRRRIFKGFVDIVVDLHGVPFYGNKKTRGIVGGQRKKGTNWFYQYMTVCVTAQRDKYTLAAAPMTRVTSTPNLLRIVEKITQVH